MSAGTGTDFFQNRVWTDDMMEFYKNLYIGDTVKKPGKVIKKLKKYKKQPAVYVIAYARQNRQLEIYHSLMLQQYYYKENPPCIIGIAAGQEEAAGLVCRIAEEALQATGQADLVAYLFPDCQPKSNLLRK